LALGLSLSGCFGTDGGDKDTLPPGCKDDMTLCTPMSALLDTGEVMFNYCSGCHGMEGRGNAGAIPPLANSDFFMNNRHLVIRIVLNW
jgi:hypothetical protein